MNKNLIIAILMILIAGGAGFFGGIKYQESRQQKVFRNFGQRMGDGQRTLGIQGNGFRPVAGEIISIDDKSITVKMQDGSSKIVLLSENTQINKASEGTKEDLKVGEKVSVFGQTNTDGSVTAQNIQELMD